MSLTHELLPHSAVRVLVSPGTLPQTAAAGLRRIADMIEGDRRLLSERHWDRGRHRQQAAAVVGFPQAPKSSS